MTTLLHDSHNPKLPPPAAYREHLDRRLPDERPAPSKVAGWIVLVVGSAIIGALFALAL